MAGLVKVILALYHKVLPPHVGVLPLERADHLLQTAREELLPVPRQLRVHAVPFATDHLQLQRAAGRLVLHEQLVVHVQVVVVAEQGGVET
jgi:hypothetical protein